MLQGFLDKQKLTIDRHSSTASRLSHRLAISLGVTHGLEMECFDISTAFFQGLRFSEIARRANGAWPRGQGGEPSVVQTTGERVVPSLVRVQQQSLQRQQLQVCILDWLMLQWVVWTYALHQHNTMISLALHHQQESIIKEDGYWPSRC